VSDPQPVAEEAQHHHVGTPVSVRSDPIPIPYSKGKDRSRYESQAEVVVDSTLHEATDSPEVNVSFLQNKNVEAAGAPTNHYLHDMTTFTDIGNFFKRPILVHTFTWNESDPIGFKNGYSVWDQWISNPYVSNKLNNYAFFRGDLHVKMQISASPFYYGMLQASYRPLQLFKADTIYPGPGNQDLILHSQRPKIEINPSDGDTYEMVLPFIYYYNMVNLQSDFDFSRLGALNYHIYSRLKSANGVTGTGVTISAYAWVDNIVLSGASAGYAAQSDEYGEGSVSKPASWVAKVASQFTNLPIIGPFATATQIGAGAISKIAQIFGFTNVPVISDTEPLRPEAFPKFASSEIGFPIEKLTLDPKNELSVDPRIVGLPTGDDELLITSLVQRDSFLCRSSWTAADAVGTFKFTTRVTPVMADVATESSQTILYGVPMQYISALFGYWRGDIILTFRVICSRYHKGKLRISYDPSGVNVAGQNIIVNSDTTNTVHTTILDIGETPKLEFRIPYQQRQQFLELDPSSVKAWTTSASPTFTRDVNKDNGMLTVRIQNILTGPTATPEVDLLVYARGAENLEFAVPDELDFSHTLTCFKPESETYSTHVVTKKVMAGDSVSSVDQQYLCHFGENIKSLRQLLRRTSKVSTDLFGAGGIPGNSYSYFFKTLLRMPPSPGFDLNGYSTANKVASVGTAAYNFVEYTPISYVQICF